MKANKIIVAPQAGASSTQIQDMIDEAIAEVHALEPMAESVATKVPSQKGQPDKIVLAFPNVSNDTGIKNAETKILNNTGIVTTAQKLPLSYGPDDFDDLTEAQDYSGTQRTEPAAAGATEKINLFNPALVSGTGTPKWLGGSAADADSGNSCLKTSITGVSGFAFATFAAVFLGSNNNIATIRHWEIKGRLKMPSALAAGNSINLSFGAAGNPLPTIQSSGTNYMLRFYSSNLTFQLGSVVDSGVALGAYVDFSLSHNQSGTMKCSVNGVENTYEYGGPPTSADFAMASVQQVTADKELLFLDDLEMIVHDGDLIA